MSSSACGSRETLSVTAVSALSFVRIDSGGCCNWRIVKSYPTLGCPDCLTKITLVVVISVTTSLV